MENFKIKQKHIVYIVLLLALLLSVIFGWSVLSKLFFSVFIVVFIANTIWDITISISNEREE